MVQEGIDAASNGDTVIVAQGTYVENVQINGKNIVLRGSDPTDPGVVANTIIDGNAAGAVVTFAGTEDETCVLSGFTIQNGEWPYGGGIFGGIEESPTHASIQNNVITGNVGSLGGGLCYCDGAIRNNAITENAGAKGGGLYSCGGTIQNNVIAGNSAGAGGGLSDCNGTIRNNVISNNTAGPAGGGLYKCNGPIENNTICDNSSSVAAGGLWDCQGPIRNCIIWGNTARNYPQLRDTPATTYSCIQDWDGEGVGNISVYPHFVDPLAGDYHLHTWSPCIDAGDPSCSFSNEPQPNGGRINMGAYGNTPEAASASKDTDKDLLPDDWELHFFGNLAQTAAADPDKDGKSNLQEYHRASNPARLVTWYVDDSVAASGDGTSWQKGFKTIQEGINVASEWDTVIVAEGTYLENIHFKGKSIHLTSADPLSGAVVASTIIDGDKASSVVRFLGTEDESCTLSGFTIQNGYTDMEPGAGIRGGWAAARTRATIENNVITDNVAEMEDGGGIARCDGIIRNNTISGNSADEGGGLYGCNATIRNNIITGNSAVQDYGGALSNCGWGVRPAIIESNTISENSASGGAGLQDCHGTIRGNIISSNTATGYGGGVRYCSGTIQNNTISGNSAGLDGGGLIGCDCPVEYNVITGNSAGQHGGGLRGCDDLVRYNTISGNSAQQEGGGLSMCDGVIENNIIIANSATAMLGIGGGLCLCNGIIRNNLIAGNSAGNNGGGASNSDGVFMNCTIVGNSSQWGGGLGYWRGTISNSVIWGNTASKGSPQVSKSSDPTYSCIQDWTGGGEGNTAEDPKFADADGPDNNPATYEDNNYRLSEGSPCTDTGANEDWMSQAVDMDGNPRIFYGGLSHTVDIGAYEYGSWPFKIVALTPAAGGGAGLTWNSRPDETYVISSCADLLAGGWLEEETVPSQGDTTRWTGSVPFGRMKFYRIELK